MPLRALALLALAVPAASAQGDWSSLAPGLGVAAPPAGGFGAEWTPTAGLRAGVTSPAYGGLVRAALGARGYAASRDDLPDFWLASASAGWGPTAALPRGLRLSGGVLAGVAHLRFEALDGVPFQNTTETEAAVGAWARLDVPVTGTVRLWTEAELLRVALAEPVTLATGSAGLAVRVETPGWLRGLLR